MLMRLNLSDVCYNTQQMCNKAVNTYDPTITFVHKCYRLKKCVMKLLILIILCLILFPFDIRLKKYVTELFPKILL